VIGSDRNLYEVPEALRNASSSAAVSVKRNKVDGETSEERKPFKPSNPMKDGEGGYITKFIRLEPKEPPKAPIRKRDAKGENDRPNFK
jgi:hypothetical protein